MQKRALVSAHIYKGELTDKDIEILTQVDNDSNETGIFDDIDHAILDQVEPQFDENGSYFFIAFVEAEFVKYEYLEGTEYGVEYDVEVIKSLNDFPN